MRAEAYFHNFCLQIILSHQVEESSISAIRVFPDFVLLHLHFEDWEIYKVPISNSVGTFEENWLWQNLETLWTGQQIWLFSVSILKLGTFAITAETVHLRYPQNCHPWAYGFLRCVMDFAPGNSYAITEPSIGNLSFKQSHLESCWRVVPFTEGGVLSPYDRKGVPGVWELQICPYENAVAKRLLVMLVPTYSFDVVPGGG